MARLLIKQLGQQWYITGDEDAGVMGPYKTKGEAEESARGIRKFYKYENDRSFFTSDKETKDASS